MTQGLCTNRTPSIIDMKSAIQRITHTTNMIIQIFTRRNAIKLFKLNNNKPANNIQKLSTILF